MNMGSGYLVFFILATILASVQACSGQAVSLTELNEVHTPKV